MNRSRASARALVASTLLALSVSLLPATSTAAEPSPSRASGPAGASTRLEPLPSIPSTVGTDHWVTFPRLLDNTGAHKLFVTTAGPAATVTVTAADGSTVATTTVAPDAVGEISVPASYALTSTDGTSNQGLHVTSTAPVSVYLGYLKEYASAGAIALPTDALGTSYRALAYTSLQASNSATASELAVIGTQDGTTVTITPRTAVNSRPAGVPFTVTLQRGQTYQLAATSGSLDVTGTTVTSDKPVAVTAGAACANVPTGSGYCNPLLQQMPPTSAWGTEFVSARLATRSKGDTYRVLADQDGTVVTANGSVVATLAAGAYWEGVLPVGMTSPGKQPVVISTSKPALVAQYANGQTYDNTSADPMMLLVPPTGQQLTSYKIATPAVTVAGVQMVPYVNIIAQQQDVGSLTLDGTPVPAAEFTAVPGSAYAIAQLRVSTGQHVLRAVHQFGVQVYEWGLYDGIGFSGGYAIAPIADAPEPPVTSPLTSTGVGTATQSATVPVGTRQEAVLLDGTATTDSVVVADQGTYTLDPDTAVITFTPVRGFSGTATPATFRVRDAWNQQSDNTYTPTVTKPAPPGAPGSLTSRGQGPRTVTVALPEAGSLVLVGATDVADQGTYAISAPGEITFTPVAGFDGTATPVTFEVRDAYGQGAQGTFTPTVVPLPPATGSLTSSGVGTAPQSVRVAVPARATVALVRGQDDVQVVEVAGQGRYVIDPATGVITFEPALGFTGTAAGVAYVVTDAYGQRTVDTYTPTVTSPTGPTAAPLTSSGPGVQSVVVTAPRGGRLALVAPDGTETTQVVTAGGTYLLDGSTGTISFAPAAGTTGAVAPVTYRVVDAYEQYADATYTPTVTAAPAVTPPPLPTPDASARLRAAGHVVVAPGSRGRVPTTCRVRDAAVRGCTVELWATVSGERTLVGSGRATVPGSASSRGSVRVRSRLDAVGRALAARPAGVRLLAVASVRTRDGQELAARARTRVVARSFTLARSVYFRYGGATLVPGDRDFLRELGRRVGRVRVVTCTGYTDDQGSERTNEELGMRRARSACDALDLPRRVVVRLVSAGERRPVATNTTEAGRARNRRASVTLRY